MGKLVKRVLSALLVMVLVGVAGSMVNIPAIAAGDYGSNGKFLAPINPPLTGSIPIRNRAQLEAVANNLSGNYHLMDDLDLAGIEWVPIGAWNTPFTGFFDGQGHVIKNLKITDEGYELNGLFGYVCDGGAIKNVGLEGTYIDVSRTSSSAYFWGAPDMEDNLIAAGGICGLYSMNNYTSNEKFDISNCYNEGYISICSTSIVHAYGGGISGIYEGNKIFNCYNAGDVEASNVSTSFRVRAYAGGISGRGVANNCYNTGNVSAICSTPSSSYSASARSQVGGIIGLGVVENCYNTGKIHASATSTREVLTDVGGIAGRGTASHCYNIGVISASNSGTEPTTNIGGIAGYGTATNCYNTGAISASISASDYWQSVGGICGCGTVSNSYNTGSISVSGTSPNLAIGGIIGSFAPSATNSYAFNLYGSAYGTQLTSEQMKNIASFVDWNFYTEWDILPSVNNGYPFLRDMDVHIGGEDMTMTLDYLKNVKFPQGKFWNRMGLTTNNQDGYTNTPCPQVLVDGKWKHVSGTSTCNGFAPNGTQLSWQCMGFTEKLAFDLYGENPRAWDRINTLTDIKSGDHIRYNGHSVLVIAVNGNNIVFADCNSDNKCVIRWDRTRTKANLAANLTWVKSAPYPANQAFTIAGRQVRIACPVDVEVYDDLGRLAARIINNVVDYDVDEVAAIAAWVEGDEKYFTFGGGFEYTFKLIGTDTGIMNIEISDIELTSETIGKQKKFINVSLEDDKLFEFTLGKLEVTEVSASKLFVVDKEGSRIAEVMENGTEISGGGDITNISVSGITLNSTALSANYKKATQLTAIVAPDNATNKTVTWKSDNEKVAKVDMSGNVQAVGRGKAKITATTEDGQKTATCEVTVKYAWWQWLIIIFLFGWLWY